jgi:ribosomal-protein-alanine N-acetyltransferase
LEKGLWKTKAKSVFPYWDKDACSSERYNVGVAFTLRDSKLRNFKLRDFAPEDFETLWRLDQNCFPPGISYSKPELRSYLRRPGSFTLVATDIERGTVAGFIVVQDGATGHVITIDVDPSARRAGVGSLLLQAAEDRLRSMGSRAVGLETAVDNVAALAFYKRHGYNVVRSWPRYYSNGVDALVMKKYLI